LTRPAALVLRLLAAAILGLAAFYVFGPDPAMLSLVTVVYIVGEAGAHQQREQEWRPLATLANLPIPDGEVFDAVRGETVRQSAVVFFFGLGLFVPMTHGAMLLAAAAAALLLWGVSAGSVFLLVAALPGVPLGLVAAFLGVVGFVSHRVEGAPSGLAHLYLSTPGGWVIRLFETLVAQQIIAWPLLGACGLVLVLGRINAAVLRARYVVPETAWRGVAAEQVLDVLVREAADDLVEAGVPIGGDPSLLAQVPPRLPDGLRQRAARNVDAVIRGIVREGRWRRPPRPQGVLEALVWAFIPADQRPAAEFVALRGRRASRGWRAAALVALSAAVLGMVGAPLWIQAIGFVLVAFLCYVPGTPRALDPGLCAGALPVDPVSLMWLSLQIASFRVAAWLPLLLLQAAATGIANAPLIALRVAVLVLALQPLVVTLRTMRVASPTMLGALMMPVLAILVVGTMTIVGGPPLAEVPLVTGAAILSLAVFVLQGTRLAGLEPRR
jgi:hypothetical protein